MRRLIFSLLLLAPVALSGQQLTLKPDQGSEQGGTVVFITGSFGSCPIVPPCHPITVQFGSSAPVAANEIRGDQVSVLTPAHQPGTVDVIVTLRSGSTVTLPDAFTFLDSSDPVLTFEKILLPVVVKDVPGAFGSVWSTELVLFNGGDSDTTFVDCLAVPCNLSPVADPIIRAGEVFRPLLQKPASRPGSIIWLPRQHAASVAMSLRIRDLSRQAQTWGTEIPVVREEEFLKGSIHLLDLPTDSRFRVLVRVYDPDGRVDNNLEVRGFSMNGEELLSLRAPIPLERVEDEAGEFYGYVQFPLEFIFGSPSQFPLVRLVIRSQIPQSRLWAFASVTNNETQHVTVVSPQ